METNTPEEMMAKAFQLGFSIGLAVAIFGTIIVCKIFDWIDAWVDKKTKEIRS